MSESSVPAVRSPEEQRERQARLISNLVQREFSPEQLGIIKNTVAKGATDDELKFFVAVCGRTGLDPFTRQIHFVKRYDSSVGEKVGAIQTGIDGYRLIAQRSGEYEGQTPAQWCGKDGQWTDLWLSPDPPFAAKVGVYRRGFRDVVWGLARWDAYVQTTRDGDPNKMWREMGPEQLAKCAEAQALRKAFPNELSGLYTHEEMARDRDPNDDLGKPLPGHVGARETEKGRRRKAATESATATALETAAAAMGATPEADVVQEGDGAGGGTEVAVTEDAPAPQPAEEPETPEATEEHGVQQPVTVEELVALGHQAHKAYKNKRLIIKEAPIGSKKWWLVDKAALTRLEYKDPSVGVGFHQMSDDEREKAVFVLRELITEAGVKP